MSQSDSAYSKVTDRILEALENADPTQWSRPWVTEGPARNAFSNRPYAGGNAIVRIRSVNRVPDGGSPSA
ncbi:MAG: DUF1738 domain-containing protein [Sandaracinaceae bacterium]|nr:DUF1738 domain-containing protein [Sandaracinaceae bacterium]